MAAPASRISLALAALLIAGGCARMEIEQGSYLLKRQVDQIESGMSREAVRRTLGKPLIRDPFHSDRWDYVFYRLGAGGERTYRRLTLFFNKEGQVARIEKAGAAGSGGYPSEEGSS